MQLCLAWEDSRSTVQALEKSQGESRWASPLWEQHARMQPSRGSSTDPGSVLNLLRLVPSCRAFLSMGTPNPNRSPVTQGDCGMLDFGEMIGP